MYRLTETVTSLRDSERTSHDLATRLEEVQIARNTAESDLAIEKQWRASLQVRLVWARGYHTHTHTLTLSHTHQMEIQREKDRVVELTNETKKFKTLQKVC